MESTATVGYWQMFWKLGGVLLNIFPFEIFRVLPIKYVIATDHDFLYSSWFYSYHMMWYSCYWFSLGFELIVKIKTINIIISSCFNSFPNFLWTNRNSVYHPQYQPMLFYEIGCDIMMGSWAFLGSRICFEECRHAINPANKTCIFFGIKLLLSLTLAYLYT